MHPFFINLMRVIQATDLRSYCYWSIRQAGNGPRRRTWLFRHYDWSTPYCSKNQLTNSRLKGWWVWTIGLIESCTNVYVNPLPLFGAESFWKFSFAENDAELDVFLFRWRLSKPWCIGSPNSPLINIFIHKRTVFCKFPEKNSTVWLTCRPKFKPS